MSAPPTTRTGAKQVLLIDAVVWTPATPASNPLRDVSNWYSRWLIDCPGIELTRIQAEGDVMGALNLGTDGVILSGSPLDAWSDDPMNRKLADVIDFCRQTEIPFLGVCYGHQLLARAAGGRVAPHPGGLELGNTPVELTPSGLRSKLFAGLDHHFEVLSSHVDAVLELPPGCDLLVQGEFTQVQAFRCDECLYGVQFHPETDPEVLRFVWNSRRETWRAKVAFNLDERLDNLRPTPAAGGILKNFVTRCVGPGT